MMEVKPDFVGTAILSPISAGKFDSLPEAPDCVVTQRHRKTLISLIQAARFVVMLEGTL